MRGVVDAAGGAPLPSAFFPPSFLPPSFEKKPMLLFLKKSPLDSPLTLLMWFNMLIRFNYDLGN